MEDEHQLLALIQQNAWEIQDAVTRILELSTAWAFPVGTPQYPPQKWYCAQFHNITTPAGHTGVDLNLDKSPWGDVDRGLPVWAVTSGVVHAIGYSASYLGGVVIESRHEGRPLYIRHWHIANDVAFRTLAVGQWIRAGHLLGGIGNYTLGAGGDHCHLDMALDPFDPHWWYTLHPSVRWVDPVPILKAYLDPAIVDAMLRKGD